MTICCIPGCDNRLADRARLKTCAACRASLHKLERQSPALLIERSTRLHKFTARTETVAQIKGGKALKVDRDDLEAEGIMMFPDRKAKRRGNVVEFRMRAKKRATT